jgi:putative copper resistance protein D
VLEPAVVVLRLLQYVGAMVLMGSSLFFLYSLPRTSADGDRSPQFARWLLGMAAGLLAVGSAAGLVAQTSLLAGSVSEGLKPESLQAVIGMDLGKAAVVRIGAALLALVGMAALRPGKLGWAAMALLGAIATASFAWSGHAAASEGAAKAVHLVSDVAHAWAAAAWIGALVAFFLWLSPRAIAPRAVMDLHGALEGFAGVGAMLVAVLIATGIINSWFLIGPDNVQGLLTTPYGRLLGLKVLLFIAMLLLAAVNRFRLTPGLGRVLSADQQDRTSALAALRRSVTTEAAIGAVVLALVAWFGILAPPSAL